MALGMAIGQLFLSNAAGAEEEVPPPQQVFRYAAKADGDRVVVSFTIAPNNYLYRSRMSFVTDTAAVTLGEPIFPTGKIHDDENFGRQEVYYDQAIVAVPFTVAGPRPKTFALTLKLQGCNEKLGICYPPQKWLTNVVLGAGAATGADPLSFAKPHAKTATGDLLPADQAFQLNAEASGPERIKLTWVIAEGYYLYRGKFAIASASKLIALGTPVFPPGEQITDDSFGQQEVYKGVLDVEVPFSRARAEAGKVDLDVAYQGCAEGRVCYPLIKKTLAIDIDASTGAAAGGEVSEQDRLGKLITGPLGLALLAFFLAGLALSLTPCVLPMVPILAGIIGTQGKDVTTTRAFTLALIYVLGMALTYAAAGAVFAMAGQQAQAAFQKPWLIAIFAAFFVFLSLPMFGLFELQMPSFIQTRIANASNQQKAGTYVGTFVMGVLASLIVTTCVAPPLVGALSYIAQSGDVLRGASALFAMGVGMGVPLLVVGASAGKLLPKAGPWMVAVKSFFGVLFLGVAVYLLDRVLPAVVTMALWAVLVFATGYWLWSLGRARDGSSGNVVVAALGLLLVVYGCLLAIGAAGGGTDALQPLKGLSIAAGSRAAGDAKAKDDRFVVVKTGEQLDARLAAAKAANRPVLVDFYADWCTSCKELEKYTFTDSGVIETLAGADLVRVDCTDDSALLERFGLVGPPTLLFFSRAGTELKARRIVGYVDANQFKELAAKALAEGA
ncbi:MAG: protein-disulfide reductase DsbD [Steroidobacteraceae bacterium]